MSKQDGKPDRKPASLPALAKAVVVSGGLGILSSLGCAPAAAVATSNRSTFAQRVQPAELKVHRTSIPDEFYQDNGLAQVTCEGQAQQRRTQGGVVQAGSGGCGYDVATDLERQQATPAGAQGVHSVSTTSGAHGHIMAFNTTAFRFTGFDKPRKTPSVAPPILLAAAATPPPGSVPDPVTTEEKTPPAAPAESGAPPPKPAAVERPPERPSESPPSGDAAAAAAKPGTVYPPLRLAGNPPRALPQPSAQAQPASAASAEGATAPMQAGEKPAAGRRPLVIAPPPAVPLPDAPDSTSGVSAALLPAKERLERLKELKDKGMIPLQLYERRRKAILQGK